MNKSIDLSIVIPVYNSADIFPELYRRIVEAVKPTVENFEIIAVLDGCRDRSCDVISEYHFSDERIKLIEFSRNFGHQAAISAGLLAAGGRMIAVMDDDLEDPPEVLVQLMNKIKEGFDVVYGIRRKRKRSFFYRYLYRLFYRLLGRLVDLQMPYDAGDFCIMRDQVVKALNAMPERNRYLRGLRAWSGFRQTGIEYDREDRFANTSGYSFKKYIALALDAVFSFSYTPLKFVSITGIIIALASFLLGARLIYLKLTGGIPDVPGWASLAVSVLFLSGIQMVSIGIIGEYISRIYDEVKQRPQYIIKQTIGLGEEGHDRSGK
jgi:polyisoprenyl-phosphate glycosyltransferase